MYNDDYNPETLNSHQKFNTKHEPEEIDPAWASVADEALPDPDWRTLKGEEVTSDTSTPARSPESTDGTRRGTVGEDLDTLRSYLDGVNSEDDDPLNNDSADEEGSSSLGQIQDPDSMTSAETTETTETKEDESDNHAVEEINEAEIQARLREYLEELESKFTEVRNMSNIGLRNHILKEKYDLETKMSTPELSNDHSLRIELAVRKRAEAILREKDLESQA